jgi:uncharacterized protein
MEPAAAAPGPMVQGFGPGGFRIDGVPHRSALLTVIEATDWSPPALCELTVEALQPLVAARPEFILLGTGVRLVRPPAALTRALEAAGVGLEPMDSRAAARAWGVLRSEGRQIAAALYPLD